MAALVPRVNAEDGTSLSQEPEKIQQLFINVHGKENAPYVWRDEHNDFLKKEEQRKWGEVRITPGSPDPVIQAGADHAARVTELNKQGAEALDWVGEQIGNIFGHVGTSVVNPPRVGLDTPPPPPPPFIPKVPPGGRDEALNLGTPSAQIAQQIIDNVATQQPITQMSSLEPAAGANWMAPQMTWDAGGPPSAGSGVATPNPSDINNPTVRQYLGLDSQVADVPDWAKRGGIVPPSTSTERTAIPGITDRPMSPAEFERVVNAGQEGTPPASGANPFAGLNLPRDQNNNTLADQDKEAQDTYLAVYGPDPMTAATIWVNQSNKVIEAANAAAQGGGGPQQQQGGPQQQGGNNNQPPPPPPRPKRNVPAISLKTPVSGTTGPITGTQQGDTFGADGLRLSEWGSSLGGGNPNEMYRWYMEAKAAGYENYEDLWNLNPEQAIGAYNQWKIREQAKGRKFIGVNDDGSGEGGRIIPVDAQANYQAEVASVEQAALAAQAAASAAQTPSTGGTGWTDISRDLVDAGFYPDMSVHEALQGAGMYGGNPFLRSVQAELGRSLSPFKLAQGVSQLQGQTPPTYGDFLQGRLGGERGLGAYGTPEILGNIVNPPSGGWELLASQLEDPRIGFDIAAHASGLGAPSFLRNELYNQQSRLQNQFQSQLSQGQIKDTLGADYFDYLRRQLGAA